MEKYQEIWREIPGYNNYLVSSLGRIKRLYKHHEPIIKKPQVTKAGYLRIMLSKGNIKDQFKIHRLVAQVFIPNPKNYPEVNHINEDKTDNRVENLEWCTREYNNIYGTIRKRISSKLSRPILQLSLDGKIMGEFSSAREASRITGISCPRIGHCCKGDSHFNTAGGYLWKYKG